MAWVYLDDQFPDHPKVVAGGDAAAWLFVCGLAYCKRYGTEGRIPKAQVPKLTGSRATGKLIDALLQVPPGYDVGLWEDDGDHYLVHDYAEWNRPQQSRSEAGRKAANARWQKDRNANADANASESHVPQDALSLTPPLPEEPSVPLVAEDDGFDEFWQRYPRDQNGKRPDGPKARGVWKRMSKAKRAAAFGAVDNYAAACAGGRWAKSGLRWLRDGDWEMWETPAEPPPARDGWLEQTLAPGPPRLVDYEERVVPDAIPMAEGAGNVRAIREGIR